MKKMSEKYHAIVGILPGVKKNITNEVILLEDVVEAAKDTIDFNADTPTVKLRMMNTFIDALAKLEKQL